MAPLRNWKQSSVISYPTVKNRLSRIASQLQLVETITGPGREEILTALERGDINAQEAIGRFIKMKWPPYLLKIVFRNNAHDVQLVALIHYRAHCVDIRSGMLPCCITIRSAWNDILLGG